MTIDELRIIWKEMLANKISIYIVDKENEADIRCILLPRSRYLVCQWYEPAALPESVGSEEIRISDDGYERDYEDERSLQDSLKSLLNSLEEYLNSNNYLIQTEQL